MKISRLITWGRGGVKEDVTYIFFATFFLNFESVEFILPPTCTPVISVKKSAYNPWTEEPCNLQDFVKHVLPIQHYSTQKASFDRNFSTQ